MERTFVCGSSNLPLTPISFLQHSAVMYPDRMAIVACSRGSPSRTWRQTWARCLSLAAALVELGVARHNVVAVFAQNIPAVCELHFAIPMAGAVICALNSRLDPATVSALLEHSGAKVIFVDSVLLDVAHEALSLMRNAGSKPPPLVVLIEDEVLDESSPGSIPTTHPTTVARPDHYYEYEVLLDRNRLSPDFSVRWPIDENDPIALNYTSGTTSRPKGVVYSHRGAYLNSVASVLMHEMGAAPVYLWTVPMFHCNGWCLVWGVAAKAGTNVCLRKVTEAAIFDSIERHGVTHMGGAPTVLTMIVNSTAAEHRPLQSGRPVTVKAGGAPPPPQVLLRLEALGFNVIHGYGLTETYGPATSCAWKPEWDALPPEQRARIKTRQGLNLLGLEMDVKDPGTMQSVPEDGQTMGEVMFRGNTVMRGYYKDAAATAGALAGGWFRTGDLAVRHEDGYVKIMDRAKDIIISGGENISTIEVEAAIFAHPEVAEAAVVARPDDYWGETPCAFVRLKDGAGSLGAEELMAFCRARLPRYMAPRTVVFVPELPRTATGKVQKVVLRERAKAMGSISESKVKRQEKRSRSESGKWSKL